MCWQMLTVLVYIGLEHGTKQNTEQKNTLDMQLRARNFSNM